MFERRLRSCVLVSNPTLTRSEFYEFLAKAFGLGPEAARSKTRFLFELRRLLIERQAAGVLSALIIDEAQSIPYELLEEIRLLSNMETPTAKLLNVVLAGQPELASRLNESSLRQLKQRISLRCELQPMDLAETASYIAGRIRIAGGRPELVFTREAIAAIYKASGGLAPDDQRHLRQRARRRVRGAGEASVRGFCRGRLPGLRLHEFVTGRCVVKQYQGTGRRSGRRFGPDGSGRHKAPLPRTSRTGKGEPPPSSETSTVNAAFLFSDIYIG